MQPDLAVPLLFRPQSLTRRLALIAAVFTVVAVMAPLAPWPATATATTTAGSCSSVSIPTEAALLVPVTMHGTLCQPASGPVSRIQLLVHGITYNGDIYWDSQYDGGRYSYVKPANAAGWATLTIDRIGYGQSTRVPSAALTSTLQAQSLHGVIGKLRSGQIGGAKFSTVVLVGHSLGSAIAMIESSLFNDADAVALTGVAHHVGIETVVHGLTAQLHPALLEPKFASYDPGYLTTVPGQREALFFSAGSDPGLVAYDEQHKDIASLTELGDALPLALSPTPTSLGIRIPTYLVIGSEDVIFCGGTLGTDCSTTDSFYRYEKPFFGPSSQLTAAVLPGSGHDLNFNRDASKYWNPLFEWANSVTR